MSNVYSTLHYLGSNELDYLDPVFWKKPYEKDTFMDMFVLTFVEKISARSIFKFVKRSNFYIQSLREFQT
jgi:hypothetical protein